MTPEPTLHDYWRIFNRRKATAFFVFGLTVLLTLFYARLQPRLYQSQTTIKLQPPASYSKIPGSNTAEIDSRSSVPTEVLVINSQGISSLVEKRFGRQVGGAPRGAAQWRYKAERLENASLIGITAEGTDPLGTRDLANAVIAAYQDYDLGEKSAQLRKTLDNIAARRSEVQSNLRALELLRQEFLKKHPNAGQGEALASRLIDLETRRRELRDKYTANHPEMIEIGREINAVESALRKTPALELDLARIVRELRMQEALYVALNTQHEETKLGLSSVVSFVRVVNPPAPDERPSSPDMELILLAGAILGAFLSLGTVFLLENLDVSISSIEELEIFLGLPVLGVIPHIVSDAAIENWLIKLFRRERHSADAFQSILIVNRASPSGIAEAYHTLRTNVMLCLKTDKKASFVFSSAGIAEGKTLTAVNFALASAHSGLKTLLVDADMRRPSIHKIFGLKSRPGLSDALAGKAIWRSVTTKSLDLMVGSRNFNDLMCFPGIENLKILNSGTRLYDVPELMRSADWTELIEDFKAEFDIVIFDTPPILLFSDPVTISKHTDGTILVYKTGKISRGALKRAKDLVSRGNAHILGVAINGLRASELDPPYDCYSYGYNDRQGT